MVFNFHLVAIWNLNSLIQLTSFRRMDFFRGKYLEIRLSLICIFPLEKLTITPVCILGVYYAQLLRE